MNITPVIMSGGSGTRLWPLSRRMMPKQFLNIHGEMTMLQETLQRLDGLEISQPIIVCNEDHRFVVAEQVRQIGFFDNPAIILEPEGRNTAPAIALAAHFMANRHEGDEMMLVLAADHVISDVQAFQQAVLLAAESAQAGDLVTFGIVPDRPETGYGYIHFDPAVKSGIHKVISFVEKPDRSTAESYLACGEYLWNSGMFMFTAAQYLDELKRYQPDIESATAAAVQLTTQDLDFIRIDQKAFTQCRADSIDYAVMEKTTRAKVVPLDAGWNEVGSWASLWTVSEKDENGNSRHGDVILHDAHNNLVMSESRLLTAVGVDDLIMVETEDVVLVARKDKSQEVKQIVDQLKLEQREESTFHRAVYRSWGCFDSIEEGKRFKVKRNCETRSQAFAADAPPPR